MLLEPPPRDRTADTIPPYSYEFSSFFFLGESAAHHEKDPQEAAAEDQGPVARVTVRACATIVWWWQISRWFLDFSIYIEIDRAPYSRRRDNYSLRRSVHDSDHATDRAMPWITRYDAIRRFVTDWSWRKLRTKEREKSGQKEKAEGKAGGKGRRK